MSKSDLLLSLELQAEETFDQVAALFPYYRQVNRKRGTRIILEALVNAVDDSDKRSDQAE